MSFAKGAAYQRLVGESDDIRRLILDIERFPFEAEKAGPACQKLLEIIWKCVNQLREKEGIWTNRPQNSTSVQRESFAGKVDKWILSWVPKYLRVKGELTDAQKSEMKATWKNDKLLKKNLFDKLVKKWNLKFEPIQEFDSSWTWETCKDLVERQYLLAFDCADELKQLILCQSFRQWDPRDRAEKSTKLALEGKVKDHFLEWLGVGNNVSDLYREEVVLRAQTREEALAERAFPVATAGGGVHEGEVDKIMKEYDMGEQGLKKSTRQAQEKHQARTQARVDKRKTPISPISPISPFLKMSLRF